MRIVGACLAFGILICGVLLLVASVSAPPPAPSQPIAFSHLQHASEMRISCFYCHPNARRSAVAGVPSVRRCMGCHDLVAYDAEEVQELAGYREREEPIPWVKVYDLPDHTRFSHDRHVQQGVECSTCHGAVETMEQVAQIQAFEMERCVDCHRQRGASLDCLTCHH